MRFCRRVTLLVMVVGVLAGSACGTSSTTSPSTAVTPTGASPSSSLTGPLTVFAAASLTEAFGDAQAKLKNTDPGLSLAYSFAGSQVCWLETARQAKLAGKSPRSTVSDITSPGGKSLQEEIEFLLNVARFHAGPLPAEFAANHPAEVA
jgi:hypothetical protein